MRPVPRVSVIVPAYNEAPYIRPAVESVLFQTLADLEVIVVDDGSTDGTPAQLAGIHDQRLRVVRQEHAGISATRNTGIGLARAPHLGFLDGDDLWMPDKLQKHLAVLAAHPEIDLTFSISRVIDEAGGELHSMPAHRGGRISFRELLVENLVRNGSAVIMRREALNRAGTFDTALVMYQDHDLWLRVALLRPGNVFCIPEALTLYRRRRGQQTRNRSMLLAEWLQLVEKVRRLAPDEVRGAEAEATSQMDHYLAFLAYEAGELAEAGRFLWLSLRHAPARSLSRSRSWLLAAACLSRWLLPAGVHRRLEAWATRRRAGRSQLTGAGHVA